MAKKKKKQIEERQRRDIIRRTTLGDHGAPSASEDPEASLTPTRSDEEVSRLINRAVVAIAVVVFLVAGGYFLTVFKSGETLEWKAELSRIDEMYEEGQYSEAATLLEAFGQQWTGARDTYDWNEKAGRYFSAAGNWEKATEYFLRALELRPKQPGIRARIGEALFQSGRHDESIRYLTDEIQQIDIALGDHDRANFYFGQFMLEQNQTVKAFSYFEAIRDREEWQEELDAVYTDLTEKVLKPAREQARQQAGNQS